MQIEPVEPMYFDADALREPTYKLFRIYTPKGRFYYTYNNGDVNLYLGVTTMLQKLLPTGEGLIKWMCDMGYDKSKEYAKERAYYGTLMHNEIAKFLINKKYSLDLLPSIVDEYCSKEYPQRREEWTEDLTSDMLAFAQFCADYNIIPLAIEVALAHPDGYSGTVDLLCRMTIQEEGYWGEVYKSGDNKGNPKLTKQPRQIIASVDFKSGRKGFYDGHEVQLESYRSLIHENFPDIKVEKIFNWSPKEWRTTPSYNLKDQSNSVDAQKFDLLVEIAKIELMKLPTAYSHAEGMLTLGGAPGDVFKKEDVIEYIKRKHVEQTLVIDGPK